MTEIKGAAAGPAPQRRRGEILDAAAEIFFRKGYDATSIQDIASSVGILKGSLYYYIDSKDDLLFEIINEAFQASLDALARVRQVPGDPLDRIHAMVRTHVHVFASTRIKSAVFFREFRSLSAQRQKIIRREGEVYTEFLRTQIRAGQDLGLVDRALDPKLTSIGVIGMLNAMSFWYKADGDEEPDAIGDEFARLVIGGLVSADYLESVGGRDALFARWQGASFV
jgi:AcrR family transcriptional regulator